MDKSLMDKSTIGYNIDGQIIDKDKSLIGYNINGQIIDGQIIDRL